MSRLAPRAALLVFSVAALAGRPARASSSAPADVAPPTEAETGRFVALESDLAADAGRASQYCALKAAGEKEDNSNKTPAEIGRKLEANPMFNGLLRRHGFSGQRFTEVSLQLFGGMLGLAMADDLDKTARAQGKPATHRAVLLQKSAEARVAAPRQAELSAVLDRVGKLCASDDEEDEEDENAGDDGSE